MDIVNFSTFFSNKMKNNLTKNQKLKNLSAYFREHTNQIIDFKDESEALKQIVEYIKDNEDNEGVILEELYYILEHYSYSTINPLYIYELQTNNATLEKCTREIQKLFKGNRRYENFEYKLIDSSYDPSFLTINLNFEFIYYELDIVKNNEEKINSGKISLTLDLRHKKCITSQTTNLSCHNNLIEYLTNKTTFTFKPYYLLKRKKTMNKYNDTEFSNTTILMVNLIYEIIPSLGYEVTIESINFTNLNAQKIKGMKLKGTDLLNENEVLQRIHSKDEVDNIKINIEKINTIAGEKTITSLSFIVDIQGRLSFIFDADMDIPYEYKLICLNIQKKLDELIYDSNSIREGVRLIEENLKLPKTLHQNLREIQQYLYDTISDENIRIDIEKFFLAEYPLSHIQIKQEV